MPKTTTGQEKLALVKRRKPTKDAESVLDSALDAVADSFKKVATTYKASMAMTKTLGTIRIPPPTAVWGERVKALAHGRHLISQMRPVLVDLRRGAADLDGCLDKYESVIAREQAEVDALLAAGAEIDEAEDEDED